MNDRMNDRRRAIAVIGGTGPAGTGLALRWTRAGETVILGSRDAARAEQTAEAIRKRVGANAQVSGRENFAACAASDLLVLTEEQGCPTARTGRERLRGRSRFPVVREKLRSLT